MTDTLSKIFDTLANMGIWIRLNDHRTEPPHEEGRAWGAAVHGFAISLANAGESSLSILIKNTNATELRASIPDWLRYFHWNVTGPDGSPAPLKPYGEHVLSDSRLDHILVRDFPSGKSLATEIPLGAIYDLKPPGPYRVQVSCPVPGQPDSPELVSNEIFLR
jgi:hypothetical protein